MSIIPNKEEYENAAKKSPSARTPSEQALVDRGISSGMQSVKNLDHEAKRQAGINGK